MKSLLLLFFTLLPLSAQSLIDLNTQGKSPCVAGYVFYGGARGQVNCEGDINYNSTSNTLAVPNISLTGNLTVGGNLSVTGTLTTSSNTFTQLTIGTGTYSGLWPNAQFGTADRLLIRRGTNASPVASSNAALSIFSYTSGDWVEGNQGELQVYSKRTGGGSSAIVATGVSGGVGKSAQAITAHVLMDTGNGTGVGQYNSGFPLWTTCQVWDVYDNCSSEINTVNMSSSDPPQQGEYVPNGLLNGLGIIAAGAKKSSSAIYIGTQDTVNAQYQRGIDFQQGAIAHYPIVLPNNYGIFSRNAANSAVRDLLKMSTTDATILSSYGNYIYFNNTQAGISLGWFDNGGRFYLREGVVLNTAGAGQPACDVSVRGLVWFVPSGAGVADAMQVCRKNAADAYGWANLF